MVKVLNKLQVGVPQRVRLLKNPETWGTLTLAPDMLSLEDIDVLDPQERGKGAFRDQILPVLESWSDLRGSRFRVKDLMNPLLEEFLARRGYQKVGVIHPDMYRQHPNPDYNS